MPKSKALSDVWVLETPDEELAAEDLNIIVSVALDKDSRARNYLRRLWDGEAWKSIKEKLLTEGSAWYVWWMDGVRRHAVNMATPVARKKRKPRRGARKLEITTRGLREVR